MSKQITVETLAQMTQQEFLASRKHLDERLRETEERILRAIEGLELKISSYASSWSRDFERLHGWVEDLDDRLSSIESKSRK